MLNIISKQFKICLSTGLVIIAVLLFAGCEKVIDAKLQIADPKIVIEGMLSDQIENQTVRVSKSVPFNESGKFNGVSGAVVRLILQSGQSISYSEISPGVYQSSRIRGVPQRTYSLQVTIEGKTYTAFSTMPSAVKADSISFRRLSFPGSSSVYPSINYRDPGQVQNQYRYLLKINSKSVADIVSEDRFNDGNNVSELIFYEGDDLKSGDKLEVELQSIDRNVFKYFFAIAQINGSSGPPVAPDNPVSNFDNGALGIFSAHTKSVLSAMLK